ncbi:signal-transducing adaptor protein 2b [Esox lucius]|uniref:signal-transducing adaptor protein 2b n=1 Tax=Esox lucius TaxID=8010 RepID=UPI0014770FA6|nr:signal-transducing adaptor protein 2b [Esox lucius]
MAATKRARRYQIPYCYYEGFLEKRSFQDKVSRKLWTCLCGNTLLFFNNSKENTYVEKLDLSEFISLKDDCSRDKNLEAAKLILHMKDREIKITAPSLETRELWKGFIYSVVELSVPDSLNLLPGQIHMLRETVEAERERRKTAHPAPAATAVASSSNLYLSLIEDMPACYHPVSRTEAEMVLEKHPESGNLLLRPGRDGASFAVSTRQELCGSIFRHYRVSRTQDGAFAIDLETPIHCDTLHDVISCLVEKTGGALTPFIMEGTYEESITFVHVNEENGERREENSVEFTRRAPTPSVTVPAPPPKPGQRDRMPFPESQSETDRRLYLNDHREAEEDFAKLPVKPPQPLPFCLPRTERKALKPPVVTPRSTTHTVTDTLDARLTSLLPDTIAQTLSEELKLKLEKRRAHEQ